ncbi:MAG: DUF4340 domain-containing protein [Myxococcales bacterium]|nr:DUF4340 domain-containing protein [Myxococcales bacterium]
MKLWKTLVALILAGGLGAYAYWGVYKGGEAKKEAETKEKLLVDVEKDPVARVTVTRADGERFTLAKREDVDVSKIDENKDTPWRLVEPFEAEADRNQARVVTNSFKSLKRESAVEGEDLDLKMFGLAPPEITVDLTTEGGFHETYYVGKKSPIGDKYYVQVKSSGAVVLTPGPFHTSVDKTLSVLREKRLFRFERPDAKSITIERPGEPAITLTQREANRWDLDAPYEAKASSTEAGRVLTSILGLRIDRFHSENDPEDASYGFDAPRMTVRVVSGKDADERTETVVIGKEAGTGVVFARLVGRPNVYVIKDKVLEDLGKGPDALRENKVVAARRWEVRKVGLKGPSIDETVVKDDTGEWIIESAEDLPKAEKQKFEDLVTAITDLKAVGYVRGKPTDMTAYGLQEPRYTVTLSKGVGSSAERTWEVLSTLEIGGEAPEGGLYARTAEEPWVYRIAADSLDKFPHTVADLLPAKGEDGAAKDPSTGEPG